MLPTAVIVTMLDMHLTLSHCRMIHQTHLLLVEALLIITIGSFYCSFLGGYIFFLYNCNGMELKLYTCIH